MIRVPPGAVILDPSEVDYLGRALEHLGQLMAEQRDRHGNSAPSQPSARLAMLTAKLRRAVDPTEILAVADKDADHERSAEPTARTVSVRALQRDSLNARPHDIGTGDAARRLGITPNAARDLARRGRLRAARTSTRWRYDVQSVAAYAERRSSQRR